VGLGFSLGSVVATFVQGLTVGALARGIPMQDGHYAGGTFGWLSPFACLTGIALCLGYALLGAGWLVAKCEGSLRQRGYRLLPGLTASVFGFLAIAFIYALVAHFQIMDRWLERPILLIFPAIGVFASIVLVRGIRYHRDFQPILMTALIFVSAFGTLAVSFWPYMIPFSVTIEQAAAPASSLRFMFWGAGLVVLPLILTYTVTVYRVFRGKIVEELHSGIVMAFEFGTNWSRLSEATGPIQGPLLAYEAFTAFALEAAFFGVLIFGRPRVSPVVYFFSSLMVALGTTFSAYWIMVNNSWMQAPTGYDIDNMHRVAAISSGALAMLPHNGAVVTLLAICGATQRGSYREIMMVGLVGPLIALTAVIVLGNMFGSF
jgi:hypothetical protein